MNTDNGRLSFAATIDNSRLRSDAAESRDILASIGQTATQEGANIDAMFGKIAKASAGIFATSKIVDFTKQIISVRGEIESLEISFETLAGKTKGNALFKEIREFATSTPMMMKDLASGAQTMLAFNIEAEKVMPILRAIGDISMGDAQKFNSLTLAFSQMSATGKLMGQDLLQMINAGFNPLSVISEKTGKTIGELKDEMEKGKITVDMVTDAFMSATSEGGKFYGMLEKQSHGIEGAISNFQGAIDDALNDMGASIQDTTVSIINAGTFLVQHYDTILDIVSVLIATYGTYRAALIVTTAVERMMANANAERIALIEAEINAVGVKTAQEQLSADADIAAAVAKGNLTEAEGLHLLALKQEAVARVESLAATAKQAAAELAAATAARKNAGVRLQAAEANAAAMRIEYAAALAKGEAFEIALAKERMETAQAEINAASQQYQAAATAEATAAKAAQTAQMTANTAAQQLSNLQTQKGMVQAGLFATGVKTLTNTLKSLWATMMKHPGALVLAAAVALAAAIYNVTKRTKELSVEQQILNDVTAQATAKVADEKTKVETLSGIVHDNNKKLGERKTALLELQKIVPDYHAALTAEGNLIDDNTDALNRYIDALMKAAKLEALKGGITETVKEMTNLAMDVKADGSDWGWFLNMLASDESIERNKQQWAAWYNDFIKDPSKYIRKGEGGRTEVLMGGEATAQWLHADMDDGWITEDQRNLIKATGKYAEFSRLYQNILTEDVTAQSSSSSASPKKWQTEVAAQREALADAQAEVKKLQASATATTEEVKEAQNRVDTAKKKLKELGINIETEQKAGNKADNANADNTDMLASEASRRIEQSEEYARRVADQERDNEMEIRQARIDAMAEGFDKELSQNQLNYDRLEEQNRRRLRDMLDALAEERVRQMEDENPVIFKKTNKDGKLEDDPGKREETLRSIRYALTVDDLSPEQKAQLEEFGKIATTSLEQANKKSLDNMLADFLTYEQSRLKITEEYARRRDDLYEKNEDGTIKTDADGNKVLRQGVTQGNLDELNRLEKEALRNLQQAISDRGLSELKLSIDWEKVFGDLDHVATSSLTNLKKKLQDYIKTSKDLSPENLKAIAEAIEKIDEQLGQRNPFEALGQSFSDLRTANENVKKAEEEYNKALKEGTDLEKKQAAAILDTARNAKQKALAEATSAIQATCKNLQQYIDVASSLSDMLEAFGVEIPAQLSGLMDGFGNALSGLESIDLTRPFSLLTGTFKTVTGIFSGIGSLFNNDDKKEDNIQDLQKQVENLQWAYDKLGDSVDGLYSKDASRLIEQQNQMLQQQKLLIQNQIAEELDKKDTDDDRIRQWQQQIEDIDALIADNEKKAEDAIFGQDIQSAIDNFASAMADAWSANEDSAKNARDMVKAMMKQMVQEAIKAAIQSSNAMERIRSKLTEFFADNVLSDWEQNYIYQMADDLQAQLDQQFGWAKSLFDDSDDGREASKKGIATASQDSIDELNGRATAIQSHTFSISENTKTILSTTQAILQSVMSIESETDGFGSRLERMENNIKDIATTLDDFATKGIRLMN